MGEELDQSKSCAIFILPSMPGNLAGPASMWIPAAGWAQALAERGLNTWIVTPLGIMGWEQSFAFATCGKSRSFSKAHTRGPLRIFLGTIKKDLRDAIRARRFRNAALTGPWQSGQVSFVWQRHELFQQSGRRAAQKLRAPLVMFVDAPVVWEARKWGVYRPLWGNILEKFIERPALLSADLVCCISNEVAEKVKQLGIPEQRIMVTPNATDLHHFRPSEDSDSIKRQLGLENCFVVGWIGSFRKFHGLDVIIEAIVELQHHFHDVGLLMIGDGFERPRIEKITRDLRISNAVFTGTVEYQRLPDHINAMDVCILSDAASSSFHYSPLKLQEYLACGKAVVAARTGQVAERLTHGVDSVLVEPGNSTALANAIQILYLDRDLRFRLARNARRTAMEIGGWSRIVEDVQERVADLS